MTSTTISTSTSSRFSAEQLAVMKKEVRILCNGLRQEICEFMENMVEEHRRQAPRPLNARLPIFYAKCYNVLRSMCQKVNPEHKDRGVEFMPQAVQWAALTQFGPSVKMPIAKANGFLMDEDKKDETLDEMVARYHEDIATYFRDYMAVNQQLPHVPCATLMMSIYFEQKHKIPRDVVNAQLVEYLRKELGDVVPLDYFQKCCGCCTGNQ